MQKVKSMGISCSCQQKGFTCGSAGIGEGIRVHEGGSGVAEERQRRNFRQNEQVIQGIMPKIK